VAGRQDKYSEALQLAPEAASKQRAVYYANLAACHLKEGRNEDAVQDSTAALQLEPGYVKALMRRGAAYEQLDDLEHALADSEKARLTRQPFFFAWQPTSNRTAWSARWRSQRGRSHDLAAFFALFSACAGGQREGARLVWRLISAAEDPSDDGGVACRL
jgi:tetratricopeptide (TPR) repeat protein